MLAVPALTPWTGETSNWCYISSGTWSLMGVEIDSPVINESCRQLNFTNEGGIAGTTRLLKNIGGLWLVQECRRIWAREGHEYTWDALAALAADAPAFASLIDPDHADFLAPDDMPAAIATFCQRTGQPVPQDHGAMIRCALESLALRYRQVLEGLEELIGYPIKVVHIAGGGTRNELLCQATADACGRQVLAGPVEATAIGNCLMQAITCGAVSSIPEARQLVRESFEIRTYNPHHTDDWLAAYERFKQVRAGG